jgi:hypothetical protein
LQFTSTGRVVQRLRQSLRSLSSAGSAANEQRSVDEPVVPADVVADHAAMQVHFDAVPFWGDAVV